MILHDTCQTAIQECLTNKRFSIARMRSEEKTFSMHVHPCHELYFSIAGGRQYLIETQSYAISPGDVFFVNQYESHCLTQVEETSHDRIVINIDPAYLEQLSSGETNLALCFDSSLPNFHRQLHLDKEAQNTFYFFIQKLSSLGGYGEDLLEESTFIEFMIFLGRQMLSNKGDVLTNGQANLAFDEKANAILDYINSNLLDDLTLDQIADHFYVSKSYLCRLFLRTTGTTISKYIAARRISIAKQMLKNGDNAMEACNKSGFNDYSNFHKTFTRTMGITPKKFQTQSLQNNLYI